MPSIYTGPDSCYGRREGIFVARIGRPGIDKVAEAASRPMLPTGAGGSVWNAWLRP